MCWASVNVDLNIKLLALMLLVSFEIYGKESSKIISQSFIYYWWILCSPGPCHCKTSSVWVPRQRPVRCWSQGPVYDPAVSNSDIVNVLCVPIWLFGMGPHELTTCAPGTAGSPDCHGCNVLSELLSANVITMGRGYYCRAALKNTTSIVVVIKTNYSHIYGFNLTSDM